MPDCGVCFFLTWNTDRQEWYPHSFIQIIWWISWAGLGLSNGRSFSQDMFKMPGSSLIIRLNYHFISLQYSVWHLVWDACLIGWIDGQRSCYNMPQATKVSELCCDFFWQQAKFGSFISSCHDIDTLADEQQWKSFIEGKHFFVLVCFDFVLHGCLLL